VVEFTKPYLWARSIGGAMMLVAHVIFAFQFFMIIKRAGPRRFAPALFSEPSSLSGEATP